jgi:hypothetical protein
MEALSYIHIHVYMQNMVPGMGLLKIKVGGKECMYNEIHHI